MHLRGLDLNLLVVLNTLLEEKNITRTGKRIYLSQSATSGALARLREFFHDELLVQIGHKMVLTPLAESLTGPVREMLVHAQAIIDQKPQFDPATSTRNFRVMVSDYMTSVLMSHVIPAVVDIAPHVTVELLPFDEDPTDKLERGEIDLLVMPEQFLSPLHPSLELFEDVYVCVGWNQNPLLPECLSMDEYLRFSHVAVHFTTQQTGTLDDWIFQSKGRSRTIAVTASAYNLLPQLVVGTPHLATVQKRLALLYASWLPIRIVEAQLGLSALVERVQWHRFRNNDPGIAWMRSVIAEQAQWVKSTDPTAASAYSKLHAVSVS